MNHLDVLITILAAAELHYQQVYAGPGGIKSEAGKLLHDAIVEVHRNLGMLWEQPE